jgi:hypothetical protein
MARPFQAIAAAAVLMLTALLSAGGALSQQGALAIDDAAARDEVGRFEALAQAARPAGQMPRITDPAVRQALATIWDVRPLDPSRRAGSADLPILMRYCEAGGAVWRSYFQFNPRGTGTPDFEANLKTYAEEIMPGFAFSVRCSGSTVEAASAYMKALPPGQLNEARRGGWHQLRLGATQVVQGTLTMLGDANLASAHAVMLARALSDSAPRFAAGLEPAERQAIVDATRAVLPAVRLAPVKEQLEGFAGILAGR